MFGLRRPQLPTATERRCARVSSGEKVRSLRRRRCRRLRHKGVRWLQQFGFVVAHEILTRKKVRLQWPQRPQRPLSRASLASGRSRVDLRVYACCGEGLCRAVAVSGAGRANQRACLAGAALVPIQSHDGQRLPASAAATRLLPATPCRAAHFHAPQRGHRLSERAALVEQISRGLPMKGPAGAALAGRGSLALHDTAAIAQRGRTPAALKQPGARQGGLQR